MHSEQGDSLLATSGLEARKYYLYMTTVHHVLRTEALRITSYCVSFSCWRSYCEGKAQWWTSLRVPALTEASMQRTRQTTWGSYRFSRLSNLLQLQTHFAD
jgi:hypothetical protein